MEQKAKLFSNILIGGNHLASSLMATCPPNQIADYDNALRKCGQPYADMWVAWKAIMEAREILYAGRKETDEVYKPQNKVDFSAMLIKEYGYKKKIADLIASDVAGMKFKESKVREGGK